MSVLVVLGVGFAGGLGALGRFALDGAVSERSGSPFPWGTFAVNLAGALLLGIVVGASVSQDALRLSGTGAIGAFTTFSTWTLESHRLAEDGQARLGAINFVASLVGGIAAVWVGRQLGGLA